MLFATRQRTSKLGHLLSSSTSTHQLSLWSSTREVAGRKLERGRCPRYSAERPVVYACFALWRISFSSLTHVPHRSLVVFRQEPTARESLRPSTIFKPALPSTNRATAERQLEPAAQPRPSTCFAPQQVDSIVLRRLPKLIVQGEVQLCSPRSCANTKVDSYFNYWSCVTNCSVHRLSKKNSGPQKSGTEFYHSR